MAKQSKSPLKIKGCKILHTKGQKPNVIRWSECSNPKDFSSRPVVNPAEIARLKRIYQPNGKWAIMKPLIIRRLEMKMCGVVK